MAEQIIYDLTCGRFDPSLLPGRDRLMRALSRIDVESWTSALNYCEEMGAARFRDAVATHVLKPRGILCSREHVLATNGALHAIALLGIMLVRKGSRPTVGVEMPGYWGFRNTLRMLGADITYLPVDSQGARADPETLARCDAVVLTPAHHFPTNTTMSVARRAAFRQLADEKGVLIVEDDYSSGFDFAGDTAPASFASESLEHTLYIGSLSKNLAPGLRYGFAVGEPAVIGQLGAIRRRIDRHSPEILQFLLAELMLSGEYAAMQKEAREAYRHRWLAMKGLLEQYFGLHSHAGGGPSFWLPLDMSWESLGRISCRAGSMGLRFTSGLACFDEAPEHGVMRLGYAGVSRDRLRGAVETLWRSCREVTGSTPQALHLGDEDVWHRA